MTQHRFTSTEQDPRRLTMLPSQIARQSPSRRHHVHGPLLPMEPDRAARLERATAGAGIFGATGSALYFAAQLLRPFL